MNGMQQEIDQLKGNVADMRKNIGFDDELFDDLDDFDKKVSLFIVRVLPKESNRHQNVVFFALLLILVFSIRSAFMLR